MVNRYPDLSAIRHITKSGYFRASHNWLRIAIFLIKEEAYKKTKRTRLLRQETPPRPPIKGSAWPTRIVRPRIAGGVSHLYESERPRLCHAHRFIATAAAPARLWAIQAHNLSRITWSNLSQTYGRISTPISNTIRMLSQHRQMPEISTEDTSASTRFRDTRKRLLKIDHNFHIT